MQDQLQAVQDQAIPPAAIQGLKNLLFSEILTTFQLIEDKFWKKFEEEIGNDSDWRENQDLLRR